MLSVGLIFSYIQFPLKVFWQFITHPIRASRNTILMLSIFLRTIVVGRRALLVLTYHGADGSSPYPQRQQWSQRTRKRYIWRVAQLFWARWIIKRAGLELEIIGYEKVNGVHSHIVVSNHQSTIDSIVYIAVLQNGCYIAKKEILLYPIIGRAALLGAQIIIDRKDRAQAMAVIRESVDLRLIPRRKSWQNSNLIFFAEGTRTRDGSLGPFKMGAFHTACEAKLPVLPIAITGTYEALPKGSLLRLKKRPKIRVEFGDALYPCGNDAASLMRRTRDAITLMIAKNTF